MQVLVFFPAYSWFLQTTLETTALETRTRLVQYLALKGTASLSIKP
jgi:hypothetical protein